MFDNVVVRPRRRKLKSVLIVGSAAVHAAVFASLAVAAMWKVSLVSVGPDRDTIAIGDPRPPAGAAALPSAGKLAELPKKPPKARTKDLVQPPVLTPEPTPTPTTGGGDSTATTGGATTVGPPDGPPCPAEPCATDGTPVKQPDPEPARPKLPDPPKTPIVPPTLAKGLRQSGDEQVFPARPTQLAMVHDGKTQVMGTFLVCVDEGGRIASVDVKRSTGYADYDDALVAAMRGWRYRPYMVIRPDRPDDPPQPTSMCFVQNFVYRITP